MSFGGAMKLKSSKKEDPLSKRVPQNPKYKNVEAVVDSGSSMTKYLKRLEEIKTNYKYKPNELFKRMKVTTFVQLVIQVSSVDGDLFFDEIPEEVTNLPGSEFESNSRLDTARSDLTIRSAAEDGRETSRSTLHGLITGTGELDIKASGDTKAPIVNSMPDPNLSSERPFLILDVRDADEFNACHIISAESFPIAMLSRSCNYESKSMLAYKNQPGKIVVVYDENEMIAPKAATTLVERGYDNLYLLSGGLKVAAKLFSQGLITGSIPPSILPNGKKEGAVVKPDRTQFTREDIFALLDQTETAVSTKSDSRLSRNSKASSVKSESVTSARSVTSTSTSSQAIHRKPFR